MTTKKKIILSTTAICLLLIVGIVAVVVAFSATKNITQSNVNVTYKSNQISGTAKAYYAVKSDSNWSQMYIEGDNTKSTEINFSDTTGEQTSSLAPAGNANISITADKTYAIFKYAFTNNSTQYEINLSLATESVPTNFTVKYLASAEDLTIANAYTALEAGAASLTNTVVGVKAGNTVGSQYVYVLVELIDNSNDASFAADFTWTLTQGTDTLA